MNISTKGLAMLKQTQETESFWSSLLTTDVKPDEESWYY